VKIIRILVLFVLILASGLLRSYANNLKITNPQISGDDKISFTVSWENSWALDSSSAPNNHDAVWIFIKFRAANGTWQPLALSSNSSDHQSDSLAIETVSDGMGVFLKRKKQGSGNINATNVTLKWAGYLYTGSFDFKVFGIEMVWVPKGSFYVGDGVSDSALQRGDKKAPFLIASENSIPTGTDSLSISSTGVAVPGGTIPQAFPKGYNGFYCMKYEITQDQYVDFLNSLSYGQQTNHVSTPPDAATGSFAFGTTMGNRNGIVIQTSGVNSIQPAVFACNSDANSVFNDPEDGETRACNFLDWNDMAAYLEWAALRPMTELEFEKICRGPNKPVEREFAWGTPNAIDANTPIYDGTDSQRVKEVPGADTGIASYGYTAPTGPLRVGFAADKTTNRLQAGASYYGAMELSGNLWEMCIALTKQGLNFTAQTGDGILPADGFANISTWPAIDCNGAGFRGGAWDSGISGEFRDLAVSDRFYITLLPTTRRNTSGGRGVR